MIPKFIPLTGGTVLGDLKICGNVIAKGNEGEVNVVTAINEAVAERDEKITKVTAQLDEQDIAIKAAVAERNEKITELSSRLNTQGAVVAERDETIAKLTARIEALEARQSTEEMLT